jgi:hypothetical protein
MMFRQGDQVFLTEEEVCTAILHFLRANGPAFSQGLGDDVTVRPAPVMTSQGRYDFVVAARD